MNREEIFERLNTVFRDVFDDESIELTESTGPDDIDDWDSLAHISLIAAIENEFGIRFDIKTALHLKSAGEIVNAIESVRH